MSLAHDLDSQGRTKEHRGETRVQPVKEDKTASDFPIETCSGSLSFFDDLFAAWSPSCDGQSDALAPTTRRHCLARFQPPASCSPSSSKSCSPSTNTRSGNWHAIWRDQQAEWFQTVLPAWCIMQAVPPYSTSTDFCTVACCYQHSVVQLHTYLGGHDPGTAHELYESGADIAAPLPRTTGICSIPV